MRDKNRIPKLLERLRIVWEKNPDLRLGQMMPPECKCDVFYEEDEPLMKYIEKTFDPPKVAESGKTWGHSILEKLYVDLGIADARKKLEEYEIIKTELSSMGKP